MSDKDGISVVEKLVVCAEVRPVSWVVTNAAACAVLKLLMLVVEKPLN